MNKTSKVKFIFLKFDSSQIAAIAGPNRKNYSSGVVKFCNNTVRPLLVYSNDNTIDIRFKANINFHMNRFALEWATIGMYPEMNT